jgi:Nucleotide-diphospho-sugar transferase
MLPLDNDTWAIQFQSDSSDDQASAINIGWYWARPHPLTTEFFARSYEYRDAHPDHWDQWIMNNVRGEMMAEGKLTYPASVVLDLKRFKSTMLFDWPSVYGDEARIDEMNAEGTIVHYTMIFKVNKVLVAKQFGHWVDPTYYLQRRALVQPVGVGGTSSQILEQLSLAAYLAKGSGRAFVWPTAVNHTCPSYGSGWLLRPPVSIVDSESVDREVSWVEGTFVRNRARYTGDELKTKKIGLRELAGVGINGLVWRCLSRADIVVIDFGGVEEGFSERFALEWNTTVTRLGIEICRDCWETSEC